jgi:hypothetical protein
MAIASRLRHTIVISRWTEGATTSPRGHREDTWEDDDETVRGWIQPRTSRELTTDDVQGVAVSDALGFVEIGASFTARDYLIESGRIFQVVGPPRDAGGRGRHLETDLRQVFP